MAATTLKLLVDNQSKKVLFAEAAKDFIDFMFGLLTLPLGTVIKLLSPQVMVGSIGKLYRSVKKLSDTYIQPGKDKSVLLVPKRYGPSSQLTDEPNADDVGGFVRGIVTYMITDDLEVTPMSAISSITLINRFCGSKDKLQLTEKTVTVGMDEGLKLLQASLKSATVLTDVFLAAEKRKPPSS